MDSNSSSGINGVALVTSSSIASLILTFAVLVIGAAIFYSKQKHRYWQSRKIPGPDPTLFIGNTYAGSRGVGWHELELADVKKYGRVFGVYQGMTPVLVVSDPAILQTLLVRDFHSFPNRQSSYHRIQRQSLLAVNGKRWKDMRMIMSPTFTSGKMKAMHLLIKQSVSDLMEYISSELESGSAEFENKELFGDLTLGVIARCAFATETNAHQKRGENPVIENVMKFVRFSKFRLFLFGVMPDVIKEAIGFSTANPEALDFLVQFSQSIVEQRKEMKSSKHHVDLLQLMIDAESTNADGGKDKLTDEEIIANVLIILLAGYDTTASLLTYSTFCLAQHPEIQEKLRAEIVEAVRADNGEIRYETIMNLKYMDAVVNETLRMFPPIIKVDRRANEDYEIKELGLKINKGVKIRAPIYAIHHEEEFFPDPFKFDPERFMPHNKHNLIPYTFLPFHTGPRNCIGSRFALLEAKTTLASLLMKYQLSLTTSTPLDMSSTTVVLLSKAVVVRYTAIQSRHESFESSYL